MHPPALRRLAALAAAVALSAPGAGPGRPMAMAQGTGPLACTWAKLPPQATQGLYFGAAALDSSTNKAYYYGGVNQAGQVEDDLGSLDLADPDPAKAKWAAPASAGSRARRYGAAGAYRPAGDKSAIYFIGGAESDGEGTNDVQVFTVKTATWRKTVPSGAVDRIFGAAVYVPGHDLIVVQGGTQRCPLVSLTAEDCQGENLGTSFLRLDDTTDEMRFQNGPNGGPQDLFGLSLVYDPAAKRVLAYGGSSDNNLAEPRVFSLDLSNQDLRQASWSVLGVEGARPQGRYFHGATFDTRRKMMVVQGGVRVAGLSGQENSLTDTWGLDLSGTTARWVNLNAPFRDLVGAAMVFAPNHQGAVLFGGRSQFKERTNPSQTSFRDYHMLDCRAAPTPTPEPTRPSVDAGEPKICDGLQNRVPLAILNNAIANAKDVRGYGERANPSLPPGPTNPLKTYLGLQNTGVPFHPLFNPVIFKPSCP